MRLHVIENIEVNILLGVNFFQFARVILDFVKELFSVDSIFKRS